MADIFLSYARADVEQAAQLVERLQAEGWTVFWDRSIAPGRQWREVLEAELIPAGCVLVLWSESAIESRWVVEEAELGAQRKALIPARLQDVEPPLGFKSVHSSDLTSWDRQPDSPALRPLLDEISALLGKRKGVSLYPLELVVVVGRPKRHPDLGHAINLTCELRNELDRAADLRSIEASATGPGNQDYDFNLRLVFDAQGLEHVRRIERETRIAIPASGTLCTGIQFTAPVVTDVVDWPPGRYEFQVRGWVNAERRHGSANLRTTFDAELYPWDAGRIEQHAALSDEAWERRGYSDDAVGIPLQISNVRTGLPAA